MGKNLKILVLHKSYPNSIVSNTMIEKETIKSKELYCKKHAYEFIVDSQKNAKVHWNEDYWAHIPVILQYFEKYEDIDYIFYCWPNCHIFDINRPLENVYNLNGSDIHLLYADFKANYWISMTESIVKPISFKSIRRLCFLGCILIKNSKFSKFWLSKLYEDKRFSFGINLEKMGMSRDSVLGDGHQVVDEAVTLYYENYPNFREGVQLYWLGGLVSFIGESVDKALVGTKARGFVGDMNKWNPFLNYELPSSLKSRLNS